jgi:hypothetical protein
VGPLTEVFRAARRFQAAQAGEGFVSSLAASVKCSVCSLAEPAQLIVNSGVFGYVRPQAETRCKSACGIDGWPGDPYGPPEFQRPRHAGASAFGTKVYDNEGP